MAEWKAKDYTQFYLFDEPTHTEAEIRREYSRMRSTLVKRAKALESKGMRTRANFIMASMPPLSLIKDSAELRNRLAEGKVLHDTKAYSLSGIRQLQRRYQAETGEQIPLGDVLEFDEYMKSWRLSAFSHMLLSSSEARELYKEYEDIGGSFADFYVMYKEEKQRGFNLPSELLRRNR